MKLTHITLALATTVALAFAATQSTNDRLRSIYRSMEQARGDVEHAREDLDAADAAIEAAQAELFVLARELARPVPPPRQPPILEPDPPVIVDPPPPTQSGIWSHGFGTMTLELAIEAARDRVDPILQAAPARTEAGFDQVWSELSDLGDNGFLSNESRHGRWGKSYGSPRHYSAPDVLIPRSVGLRMDNVWLSGPWDEASTGAKWFVRMSNLPSAHFSRMRLVGTILNGRAWPKEHGVYVDVSGSVSFTDCLFEDLGGHGVYVNNRAYAFQQFGFITLPFTETHSWTCDNVIVLNCEQDASRSAYNFTFNDAGSYAHPGVIRISNCVSITAWPFQRSQGDNVRHPIEPYIQGYTRASGGMVVTNFDSAHMSGEGWPTESVTIEDSVFWTVQARHSILSLRGAESYLIKDSFVKAEGTGHNSLIEIGSRDGRPGFRGPRVVIFENVMAEGVRARIWRDSNNFEIIDLNTLGVRQTWTPTGITVESL